MRRRLVAEGKDGSARRQNDLLVDLDVLEDAVVVAAADLVDVAADSGGDDTGMPSILRDGRTGQC